MKKPIVKNGTQKIIDRKCSICGKKMKIILYSDGKHKGGYYFFDIPICSKKEWAKSTKAVTRKGKLGKMSIDILKYDPKPYKYVEYWECPVCYKK